MLASSPRSLCCLLFVLCSLLSGGLNAPVIAQAAATATFIGSDTKTQGNWKGTYGADGYTISQDTSAGNPALPAYATVALSGSTSPNGDYTWAATTTDPRGLLKAVPGTTDRLAACWYSRGSSNDFDVDVSLTDGQAHRVSLYCLDWDGAGRVDAVTVKDAVSGATLDAQTAAGFSGGTYLTWAVKGHVVFHFASGNNYNAVLSALFFDTASATGTRIDAGSTTPYTDSLSNVWSADQGSTGGTVEAPTTPPSITNTNDPKLYQTQRVGSTFSYALPVANGSYILGLSFAEIDGNTKGGRLFNVTANGTALLTGFDIYAAAGGANKAITKSFLVKVTNGQLSLAFTGTTGQQAAIAAISVLKPSPALDIPPPGWAEDVMPSDDASDAEGMGPAAASSVNLASGVEENSPGSDLAAYNPVGPSASYERRYRSARAQKGYASPGLSPGWMDGYDMSVVSTASGYTLTYDNGGQDQWAGTSGSLGTPPGAPYLVNASGGALTMTFKDRSKYTFTQIGAAGGNYAANTYLLTGITNLVGHAITLNRDTAANGYRLLSITNDASPALALLIFAYDGNGNLNTVTDAYNRQITYRFSGGLLTSVLQIAAAGTSGPPARWQYGYAPILGFSLLNSVSAPDPSNPGTMATATTTYDPTNGSVSQHQDAAGRVHSYGYTGSQTIVQVANVGGSLAESWTQNQNATGAGKNASTGTIGAAGKAGSVSYVSTPSPYLPNAATNRNGQTAQITYDTSNGFANVASVTDNRGVQINTGYDYSTFTLGQPNFVQRVHVPSVAGLPNPTATPDSALTPTQITYFNSTTAPLPAFNGLVSQTLSPQPDTVAGTTPTIPTLYAYDQTLVGGLPLGNVQSVTTVGPNSTVGSAGTYTTASFTYTNGATATPSLGEPLSVTVTGQAPGVGPTTLNTQTSTFTYDNRGNPASVTDASGFTTTTRYNLADQVVSVNFPATGSSGSGSSHTDTTYQYVGGPVQKVVAYDENNAAVREVDYAYTKDGETSTVTGSTQPASYVYDGRGRVTQSTDGNSHSTFYTYDSVGNLYQELFPLSGTLFDTLTYGYDADQNLLTKTDGRGVVTTYIRADPESLVTGVSYSALPANVTAIAPVAFAYDSYGRRTTMNDGTGLSTYGPYDDLDELLSVTKNFTNGPQNQTLAYAHNPDGSRLSLAWPFNVTNSVGGVNLGKTNYAYDGLGRQVQTKFPWLYGIWQHQYQANGWVKRTDGPLSPGAVNPLVRTQYSYNQRGFLTLLSNYTAYSGGGSDLLQGASSFALTYDALGNKRTEAATVPAQGGSPLRDASHTLTYGYDDANGTANLNRDVMLSETSVASGGGAGGYNTAYSHAGSSGYGYDAAYNPTLFSYWNGGADATVSLPVNADNQVSLGTFAFDGAGNPTAY